uniref:RRM domain-containing protein n=1 Tax=Phytophthora ramorum TaxID=164328 RepID=H3HEE0_PHYRM
MDAERERIERARAKNLAYIRQQDEQQASQAADELLSSVLTSPAAQSSAKRSTGNSSVYITGLSTYMACRQLEGVCSKIGKVRRVKFYKDERGGLKVEYRGSCGRTCLDLPSRSIILKHIWDPLEGSDAAFLDELEDDMRAECGKHGAVEHVQIVADGSVVVRFVELKTAVVCLKVMNGRWFAGRQIEAQFDQSTTEDPGDPDTKVEAFLASLGE